MNQTIKNLAYGVGLFFVFVFWLHSCHDPQVAQHAVQGQQDHIDDSTHVANDLWKAQFLARDTARDDSLRHITSSLHGARGEIARLKATIPPPITPSDTARDVVIAEQAAFIQQQDSSFAAERRLFRAMLVDRDSVIAKREREITALTTARDTWKRAASPGALTKLGRALPYIAGGFVLAKIIR